MSMVSTNSWHISKSPYFVAVWSGKRLEEVRSVSRWDGEASIWPWVHPQQIPTAYLNDLQIFRSSVTHRPQMIIELAECTINWYSIG